ncbi:MAG: DUF1905 domain-containing protein [Saprospiraceae bacterium]|nr:DUF1905 domain-containing protein [Saprospiraceae bacterium]
MKSFHTILQSINGATSPIVIAIVPFDVKEVFGNKARVDIRGTIDSVAIERTLLPLGDGRHYFMLNAKILKAIRKKTGDEVFIEIDENEYTKYKEVELPDYFLMELAENPIAKTQYELSNPSTKRWIAQFVTEPKSLDAKANRVIKAIEFLERHSQNRLIKEGKKSKINKPK